MRPTATAAQGERRLIDGGRCIVDASGFRMADISLVCKGGRFVFMVDKFVSDG
jgi:hypothetical protein